MRDKNLGVTLFQRGDVWYARFFLNGRETKVSTRVRDLDEARLFARRISLNLVRKRQTVTIGKIKVSAKILNHPIQRLESSLEAEFFNILKIRGSWVGCQVKCSLGQADIVTEWAVYELKVFLTRESLARAVGQALAYRFAIDPQKVAAVVYRESDMNLPLAGSFAQSAGVRLFKFPEDIEMCR